MGKTMRLSVDLEHARKEIALSSLGAGFPRTSTNNLQIVLHLYFIIAHLLAKMVCRGDLPTK